MIDRGWTHFWARPAPLRVCLVLAVIGFCLITSLINQNQRRLSQNSPYAFTYTGSGLLLGAQIWSALGSTAFWMLKAAAYERAGSIDAAERALTAAVNVSNGDPAISFDYVQFLERRGRTQDAEQFLVSVHDRRPDDGAILAKLAQIELALRHWDKAAAVAEAIRKLGAPDNVADQVLGAALMGEGKTDSAIEIYRAAADRPHAAATAVTTLATALIAAHKTEQATGILKTAIERSPDNAEALVLLGWTQVAGAQPDQARKSFAQALERQPKNGVGYLALAQLDFREQHVDAALETLRSALRAMPGNPIMHIELANGLQTAQRYEDAIAEYEDMLSKNPDSMIAANNLAILLVDHRHDPASLRKAKELTASLTGSPVPQFMDTRGWVSYRSGEYDAAIALLQRAAAAAPDRVAIRYHLGMAYLAKRNVSKAAAELKAAAALNPDRDLAAEISTAIKTLGD